MTRISPQSPAIQRSSTASTDSTLIERPKTTPGSMQRDTHPSAQALNLPGGRSSNAMSMAPRTRPGARKAVEISASEAKLRKLSSKNVKAIERMITKDRFSRSANALTLERANEELVQAGFAPLDSEAFEVARARRELVKLGKVVMGLGTFGVGALAVSAPLMGAKHIQRVVNNEVEFMDHMTKKYGGEQ